MIRLLALGVVSLTCKASLVNIKKEKKQRGVCGTYRRKEADTAAEKRGRPYFRSP